jgi:carbon storage regulator
MLVLSRKENERIKLGDSIVVTVVRVGRDKVRLGIEAPSDMLVLREELEAANTANPTDQCTRGGARQTEARTPPHGVSKAG